MFRIDNKNKDTLTHTLIQLTVTIFLGVVVSFVISSLLRVSLFNWDWYGYKNYLTTQLSTIFWLETGFLFMLYLWLVSFLRSKWGAASLFLMFATTIAIANQQKMFIRGEPIYPSDFDMIKVLPEIMQMIDLKIVISSIFLILIMLIFSVLLVKRDWSKRKRNSNIVPSILTAISFITLSYGLAAFYNFNQPGNVVRATFDPYAEWIHWSQQENYQKNGFIPGFLYNLPGQPIEKPTYYNYDKLEEIVAEYTKIAQQKNESIKNKKKLNPNIIFIMNESFSDPKNLDNINISSDPIAYFSELSEENLSGNVLISGYGGGTANAEFEALTTISLEPLSSNISTPYIQMNHLMDRTPNIVSWLKDKDYRTTAIHPYNTTMYKRPDVYSSLGFDEFIYDETMENLGYHENNGYISDLSAYEEVVYQMKQTEKKDFIHLVTMHGHKSYHDNYEELTIQVDEINNNENIEVLQQYYQGLLYSDQDFKNLIEQINLIEEDTLIVFWGDHLPGIYTSEIFTKKHKIDMYETPVLFYKNFESAELEKDIKITTPFYFRNYISNIMNAPISGYEALMIEMEKNISAFKRGIYIEAATEKIVTDRNKLTEKSKKILSQYDMVLYDLLEGNQKTAELGFYEIPY